MAKLLWQALLLVNVLGGGNPAPPPTPWPTHAVSGVCNGKQEYCKLRIDQYTFAGAHNSWSRLATGMTRNPLGFPAPECWFVNQATNPEGLLNKGVRFFDIDSCQMFNKLATCHGNAFQGFIYDGLYQIQKWMETNRNEVVMLFFNHETNGGDRAVMARDLASQLTSRFTRSGAHFNGLEMSTYYDTHKKWPTLGHAINTNQRLFVLVTTGLLNHIPTPHPWALPSWLYGYSWGPVNVGPGGCGKIVDNAKAKCGTSRDFQEVSAYGSHAYGNCIGMMALLCSKDYRAAAQACYDKRQKMSPARTLNMITVDYATVSGVVNVMSLVDEYNTKNVAQFTLSPVEQLVRDLAD